MVVVAALGKHLPPHPALDLAEGKDVFSLCFHTTQEQLKPKKT